MIAGENFCELFGLLPRLCCPVVLLAPAARGADTASKGTMQLTSPAFAEGGSIHAKQGLNDFKHLGYGGPCPPPGKGHRYFFKLYALDRVIDLKPGRPKRNSRPQWKSIYWLKAN